MRSTPSSPMPGHIPSTRSINVVAPKLSNSPSKHSMKEKASSKHTMKEKVSSYRSTTNPLGSSTIEALTLQYNPGKWDIYLLGVTIVIGGQYFCWNAGLAAGLYSYLIAYFLIASGYLTLCCCTSEITGALPFAGGAYGLARCTLGFFPAFLIGCCEALEYIAYVSTSVLSFVDMVVSSAPSLDGYRPLLWALFYLSALCFHVRGDRAFWVLNIVLGVVSIVILLLFVIGALPYVDYNKYATSNKDLLFVDGMAGFMKALPLAAWFFVGVEALSLASDQVPQPKIMVPFGQITCVLTLVVTGVMVFFVSVSLPPGLQHLPSELVPFNNCFELLMKISHESATVFSLPATYATAFGFMWCYGKLISAMATSRLLPPVLSRTSRKWGTPYVAVIAGSALSYSLCLMVYLVPSINQYLFNVCIVAAFMSYSGQCVGFVMLKLSYRNIKSSQFRSPFGIIGALYSLLVWLASILSIAAFQGNGGVEIIVFLLVLCLLSMFYYSYSRRRQTFSAQENRIMLVAHVTKFNARKIVASRNGRRKRTSSGGSKPGTKGGADTSTYEGHKASSMAPTPHTGTTARSTGY